MKDNQEIFELSTETSLRKVYEITPVRTPANIVRRLSTNLQKPYNWIKKQTFLDFTQKKAYI